MADDMQPPHAKLMPVSRDASLADLLRLAKADYLPNNIQGGCPTWVAAADEPLGVLAQQWGEPVFLVSPDRQFPQPVRGVKVRVYFHYLCQTDPETVVARLRNGETLDALVEARWE